MVGNIRHKGLREFFQDGNKAGIAAGHVRKLRLILTALNSAESVMDLSAPIYRLHALRGNRKGRWAMDVSGAWRVTFEFRDVEAIDVDYEQYH